MTALLEIKQNIKRFYGQYEVYILPVLKFVLAFAYFLWINSNMGYMKQLDNIFVDADPVPKIQQVTESCKDPYTTFLRIWCSCTYADRSRPAG